MTGSKPKPGPPLADPQAVIDAFFTLGAVAAEGTRPSFVLIAGPVASGKTTHRKKEYAAGYVVVDAAALFLAMAPGQVLDFPGVLEQPLDVVGSVLAHLAIEFQRNIVTEIIGMDADTMTRLVDAMTAVGYQTQVVYITCDVEAAWQRNCSRGENDISAYYAEPFNVRWLTTAALAIAAGEPFE
jgi:hypothetical protein